MKCGTTNGVMRGGGENSLGIPAGRRSGVGEWCFLNPILDLYWGLSGWGVLIMNKFCIVQARVKLRFCCVK